MNGRVLSTALASALLVSSVTAEAQRRQQLTPMELQALQTREFETTKEMLFAAVVSVFQDLGYQLEGADLTSGFITANSATQNRTSVWNAMAGQRASGNTRATAFVEQMPNGRARVRLNFLNTRSTSSMYGQNERRDRPVVDPATYSAAWDKIDEALFVRSAIAETDDAPAGSDDAHHGTGSASSNDEPERANHVDRLEASS
jgi:hypothetical protein